MWNLAAMFSLGKRAMTPALVLACAVVLTGHVLTARGAPAGAEPDATVFSVMASPAGDWTAGPRANGTGVLPDGRFVTPVGRSTTVDDYPMNGVLSHDGKRLYVSSEGYDDAPLVDGGQRFLDVIDTATMTVEARIEDDAMHFGIAESPDGLTLYVAEGQSDAVGVFHRAPGPGNSVGTFEKVHDWTLNSKKQDYPWGLALSPDGKRVYVAGFSGDSLTTVDATTGTVLSQVSTGAYPYDVVLSPDGTRAYVSNWGLYNADAAFHPGLPVAVIPTSYGGYNSTNSSSVWTYDLTGSTPKVIAATRIGEDLNGGDVDGGSSPSGMALSPDGKTLAVMSSNDDEVDLLDVSQTTQVVAIPSTNAPNVPAHPSSVVDMRALVGWVQTPSPTGSQPNAAAWSPDGKVLFVAEGERNDVAVIDPSRVSPPGALVGVTTVTDDGVGTSAGANRAAIVGRIPTAWYPSALQVSADSSHLYVVSMRGLGSGPSVTPATASIKSDVAGQVNDVHLTSTCASLASLSRAADRDNGLVALPTASKANGNGYVVPTAYGQGPSSKIKHVFLIIKENRSFDDIFGDMSDPSVNPKGNVEADGSLTHYGAFVTPNEHALAKQFALSDNYYVTAETSTQGHYAIDTGQDNEFIDKTTPSNYAGKFPYGAWDTLPEGMPEGGFIWNNAARHGVHTTVFGEATVLVGLPPTLLGRSPTRTPSGQFVPGVQNDGYTFFDPTYPTQVDFAGTAGPASPGTETAFPFNDEGRASAFAQAVAAAENQGGSTSDETVGPNGSAARISQFNVMLLFDDHTAGYLPNATSPEDHVAENDHSLGRVIDTISHSSYWKDSAVFVAEDDTQGGQDHVDAHRSFGMLISPWARHGYVSHVHTSFSSMTKTIDLLLGLPPTSLQEMTATSMADMFIPSGNPDDAPYTPLPNNTTTVTNPTAAKAPNALSRQAAELAMRMPHRIDAAGNMLPADLDIGRRGAMEAGDPNVKPAQDTITHTLTAGDPQPLTTGPEGNAHGQPGADACLAGAVGPMLPEAPLSPWLLVPCALLVVTLVSWRRRPRRASTIGPGD